MTRNLKPRLIKLNDVKDSYFRILPGPPDNFALKSGLVNKKPGESVGEHTTGDKEELLIVLSGEGRVDIEGAEAIQIRAGDAVYIPPDTKHDVFTTGEGPLRYIFIVAKALA